MTRFNSVPVDNVPASCGLVRAPRSVDKTVLPPQKNGTDNSTARNGSSGLCTIPTGSSTTTLFFFDSSNNK